MIRLAIVSLVLFFAHSFAFAGTGMNIRLSSLFDSTISLNQTYEYCVRPPHQNTIAPNTTVYFESDDSSLVWDPCSPMKKNSQINFVLNDSSHVNLANFKFRLKYLEEISDYTLFQPPYTITMQHFPNYGIGSQDSFEISVSRDPGKMNAALPLNKQMILGSHDSGTYTITSDSFLTPDALAIVAIGKYLAPNLIAGWAKTQNFSIFEQLTNGVRYIDLRLCGAEYGSPAGSLGHEIVTCHALSGASLEMVLSDIKRFIQGNPNTVLIVDINHLYDITIDQLNYIMESFNNALPSKIASAHLSPNDNVSTFIEAGTPVVLAVTVPDLSEDMTHVLNQYNYWGIDTLQSPYINTDNLDTRIAGLNQSLSAPRNDALFVLQTQLTPSTQTIINGINALSTSPRNMPDFTGSYQLKMSDWIMHNLSTINSGGFIVLRDFVGTGP